MADFPTSALPVIHMDCPHKPRGYNQLQCTARYVKFTAHYRKQAQIYMQCTALAVLGYVEWGPWRCILGVTVVYMSLDKFPREIRDDTARERFESRSIRVTRSSCPSRAVSHPTRGFPADIDISVDKLTALIKRIISKRSTPSFLSRA